jgi:DNA-binding transcriptional MerR regulator
MLIQFDDTVVEELDKEWINLMQIARKLGIPLEKIRKFLSSSKQESNRQDKVILEKGMVKMKYLVQELKSEEYLLGEILTSIMDIVYLKDANGNWIEANEYVQKLFKI